MTYFTTDDRGRVDFDSRRFLSDLAGALGGTNLDPEYQGGTFDLDGLRIYLRAGYGAKARRVTVSCGTTDKAAHALAFARGKVPDFPRITIDPDRPLETIVRDIRHRVIEAASGPLTALQRMAEDQAQTASELKAHANALNTLFPGVVTMPGDPTKREAPFYLNAGGVYLSGRLNCDGALYVDRLGTVPASKLVALITLLREGAQ